MKSKAYALMVSGAIALVLVSIFHQIWKSVASEKTDDSVLDLHHLKIKAAEESASRAALFLSAPPPPQDSKISPAIPFYIYDTAEFSQLDENCFKNESAREVSLRTKDLDGHLSEYYFIRQLRNHAWRRVNPDDALIYVVPLYGGMILGGSCGDYNSTLEILITALNKVKSSVWYRRNSGNDHIFVSTHWRTMWWLRDRKFSIATDPPVLEYDALPEQEIQAINVLKSMIYGRYGAGWEDTFCSIVVPYTSNQANSPIKYGSLRRKGSEIIKWTQSDLYELGRQYLNNRPYQYFFLGSIFQEHHRNGYASRRQMFVKLREKLSEVCQKNFIVTRDMGEGWDSYIPACDSASFEQGTSDGIFDMTACYMKNASVDTYSKVAPLGRFHLSLRGDDWTSRRLWDAIASGSLSVIISDGMLDKGLPFSCSVDWENIVYFIPMAEFEEDPILALQHHIPDTNSRVGIIDVGRRVLLQNLSSKHLDWTTSDSRVAENTLRNAVRRCLPEAHLLNWTNSTTTSQNVVRSLRQLQCPFNDYEKGVYRPSDRMGGFQKDWGLDD